MLIINNLEKNKNGFSLVEVMVFVLIIAILITIATPVFSQMKVKAQDKSAQKAMMETAKAIASLRTSNKTMPTALTLQSKLPEYNIIEGKACPANSTTNGKINIVYDTTRSNEGLYIFSLSKHKFWMPVINGVIGNIHNGNNGRSSRKKR